MLKHIFSHFTLLLLMFQNTYGSPPIIQLSTGVQLTPIPTIPYETSSNILYTIPIPDLQNTSFLDNLTCTGADCDFIYHIQQINRDTLHLLNNTLPSPIDLPNARNRRALDFIGDLEHWCCGVATNSQIDALQKENQDLTTIFNQLKQQLAVEHDSAVQSNTLVNTYSNEMKTSLESIISQFKGQSDIVSQLFDDVETEIVNLLNSMSFTAKTIHHTATSLVWLKTLSDCNSGRLPRAFVNDTILTQDLNNLENELFKHAQKLAISKKHLNAYYISKLVTCYITPTELGIRLQVPVITANNAYQVFSITQLPFIHNKQMCQLNLPIHHVAVRNHNVILPLIGSIADNCIRTDNLLCHLPRYPTPTVHHTCLTQITNKNVPIREVAASCPFICSDMPTDAPHIVQLSPNSFGILLTTGDVTITCANSSTNHKPTAYTGLITIKLACGCQMTITGHPETVSPDFPCHNASTPNDITHIIPAPWTQSIEDSIYSPDARFTNATKLLNTNWHISLPVTNLSALPPPLFELPTHIVPASYLTLAITIVVFILIFGFLYVFLQTRGAAAALAGYKSARDAFLTPAFTVALPPLPPRNLQH